MNSLLKSVNFYFNERSLFVYVKSVHYGKTVRAVMVHTSVSLFHSQLYFFISGFVLGQSVKTTVTSVQSKIYRDPCT